jgi:hypothetical protein
VARLDDEMRRRFTPIGFRPLLAGLAPGLRLAVVDRPQHGNAGVHQEIAALSGPLIRTAVAVCHSSEVLLGLGQSHDVVGRILQSDKLAGPWAAGSDLRRKVSSGLRKRAGWGPNGVWDGSFLPPMAPEDC